MILHLRQCWEAARFLPWGRRARALPLKLMSSRGCESQLSRRPPQSRWKRGRRLSECASRRVQTQSSWRRRSVRRLCLLWGACARQRSTWRSTWPRLPRKMRARSLRTLNARPMSCSSEHAPRPRGSHRMRLARFRRPNGPSSRSGRSCSSFRCRHRRSRPSWNTQSQSTRGSPPMAHLSPYLIQQPHR